MQYLDNEICPGAQKFSWRRWTSETQNESSVCWRKWQEITQRIMQVLCVCPCPALQSTIEELEVQAKPQKSPTLSISNSYFVLLCFTGGLSGKSTDCGNTCITVGLYGSWLGLLETNTPALDVFSTQSLNSTQLNSTENYGRRCLTPLSPHRNYILS